jgi:TonB family protein
MKIFETKLIGIALILGSVVGLWAQSGPSSSLPEKYRKWLDEDAAYIISSRERDVFLSLATDGDRDLFIESFWKQRDPTPATQENEFRTEHLRRLDAANRRFSTPTTPGWKTDWGRLYIILGDLWPSLRLFEGIKDEKPGGVTSVSASVFYPTISASIEAEDDIVREGNRLAEIFNLRKVGLVTEGLLGWPGKWAGKRLDHVIELEDRNYLFTLIPKGPAPRLFGIIVSEVGGAGRQAVLETEIVLPEEKAAVFGFQTSGERTYFLYLRIPPLLEKPEWTDGPQKRAGASEESRGQNVPEGTVKVEGQIPPPRRLKYVAPEYPRIAKRARVEGVVMLNVRIDERGKVENVDVVRSIPLLDQAAVDAVRKWEYEPLRYDGKIVKAEFAVALRFSGDGLSVEVSSHQIPAGFLAGAVRVEEDVARRLLLKYVDPEYPEIARQARVEGFVVLGVLVNETGLVENVTVMRSIPLLDQAAIEAVRHWIYRPPVMNGAPCKIAFVVSLRFQLI